MKKPRQKSHLFNSLRAMSVVPLLILGIFITAFGYSTIRRALNEQLQTELQNTTDMVIILYDSLYPGDYHLEGEKAFSFYKGDQNLTGDCALIDQIKEVTDTEITLFWHDTRILTTIRDTEGARITGTGANSRILNEVLATGEPHFYTNTTINEEPYFAYYEPVRNGDGTIVGMVYAGKPCTKVNATVKAAVLPVILFALVSMFVVSVICSSFTNKLTVRLQGIRTFLSRVSGGNLQEELGSAVLQEDDELSEIGYSALYMQRSIRNLIEMDALTDLNNRRSGDRRLKQTLNQAESRGTSFVVGIGDIDFFKSVNDTYGHECGDIVLKRVADILKKHMFDKGFVARWGGEEFLFIYDNSDLDAARENAEKMLDDIRAAIINYEDQTVRVTMSFGFEQGGAGCVIKELLQKADEKLYYAKGHGRNQVVTDSSLLGS